MIFHIFFFIYKWNYFSFIKDFSYASVITSYFSGTQVIFITSVDCITFSKMNECTIKNSQRISKTKLWNLSKEYFSDFVFTVTQLDESCRANVRLTKKLQKQSFGHTSKRSWGVCFSDRNIWTCHCEPFKAVLYIISFKWNYILL